MMTQQQIKLLRGVIERRVRQITQAQIVWGGRSPLIQALEQTLTQSLKSASAIRLKQLHALSVKVEEASKVLDQRRAERKALTEELEKTLVMPKATLWLTTEDSGRLDVSVDIGYQAVATINNAMAAAIGEVQDRLELELVLNPTDAQSMLETMDIRLEQALKAAVSTAVAQIKQAGKA